MNINKYVDIVKKGIPNKYIAPAPTYSAEASDTQAYLMGKHFVTASLKAPSTAVFPSIMFDEPYTVSKKENIYTIYSYVDSQNGFGAMIRTYYTIKIRFLGGEPLDISDWEYIDMSTE